MLKSTGLVREGRAVPETWGWGGWLYKLTQRRSSETLNVSPDPALPVLTQFPQMIFSGCKTTLDFLMRTLPQWAKRRSFSQ